MTKEELKEKIINVLSFVDLTTTCTTLDKKLIADALIEAGIGDVETTKKIGAHATEMAVLRAAEAEHRAEVAERAFDIILTNMSRLERGITLFFAIKKISLRKAIEQAEKELAEERREP